VRNRFDEQLEQLNVELIKTGALCEDAISTTAKALIDNDRELARRVKPIEREIDQKERDIESLCMKLLLQQQPVARDLRQISSALKMISDLERIGDQASDIAEILPYLQGSVSESKLHIKEMAQATIKMVTDSIESFVRRDLPLARSVVEYDNVVDGLFNKVKTELIRLISEDSNNGEFCIDLLMVAKYFERIGDHAVNVAEWVQYSLTGRKGSLLADADDIPWTEDMA
jgi:phosphate transport system protein